MPNDSENHGAFLSKIFGLIINVALHLPTDIRLNPLPLVFRHCGLGLHALDRELGWRVMGWVEYRWGDIAVLVVSSLMVNTKASV